MKSRIVKLVIPLCVAVAGFQAHAEDGSSKDIGLFVEPALTYEGGGESKTDWPAYIPNDSSGSVEGFGVGARLGIHLAEIFFVGADARYSKPTVRDSSTNDYGSEATAYNYGVVAGLQTPIVGLRVWGTYIAGGELDPKEVKTIDLKFKDGAGYRVGAGFKLEMVSINLEFQSMKYNTTEVEKVGPFAGTLSNSTMTNESYVVSLSFPMAL